MSKLYAVVKRDGEIKRSRRSNHLLIYTTAKSARKQCLADGDSVVEVELDLTREPLYIRRHTI